MSRLSESRPIMCCRAYFTKISDKVRNYVGFMFFILITQVGFIRGSEVPFSKRLRGDCIDSPSEVSLIRQWHYIINMQSPRNFFPIDR